MKTTGSNIFFSGGTLLFIRRLQAFQLDCICGYRFSETGNHSHHYTRVQFPEITANSTQLDTFGQLANLTTRKLVIKNV
jgi:hypothetical protein